MAAPSATTSSGFIDLFGSLPKNSLTAFCIAGILVCPPTSITSSMSDTLNGEASIALFVISIDLSIYSRANSSSVDRVIFMRRCFGPEASEVMNGIFISVSVVVDSSCFAFSAASSSRWSARGSFVTSIPESFLNSSAIHLIIFWSISRPPM